MNPRLLPAVIVALVASVLLGLLKLMGSGFLLLMLVAVGSALAITAVAWNGMRGETGLGLWWRERLRAGDEGTHHAFAGIRLQVEDDGELIWLKASGVQRVLGLKEEEIVTASRVPGQWRRDDDRALWLRVDGLIQTLNTMPGRTEPRVQRFRRYLERDLLFPANERRRRG